MSFDKKLNENLGSIVKKPKEQGVPAVWDDLYDFGIAGAEALHTVPTVASGALDFATLGGWNKATGVSDDLADIGSAITEQHSPAFKAQQEHVSGVYEKNGLVAGMHETVKNPMVPLTDIFKSLPVMLGSSVAGGAAEKVFSKIPFIARALRDGNKYATLAASALRNSGEGLSTTADITSQVIQQDGDLSLRDAALAATGGFATSLISTAGHLGAKKLGAIDPDTMFGHAASRFSGTSAYRTVNAIKGGIPELLEEMGQGVTETYTTNLALEQPVTKGMAENVGRGGVSGFGMGALPNFRKGGTTNEKKLDRNIAIEEAKKEELSKTQQKQEVVNEEAVKAAVRPVSVLDDAKTIEEEKVEQEQAQELTAQEEKLTNEAEELKELDDIAVEAEAADEEYEKQHKPAKVLTDVAEELSTEDTKVDHREVDSFVQQIYSTAKNLKDFTAQLIQQYGEGIKKHALKLYNHAKKTFTDERGSFSTEDIEQAPTPTDEDEMLSEEYEDVSLDELDEEPQGSTFDEKAFNERSAQRRKAQVEFDKEKELKKKYKEEEKAREVQKKKDEEREIVGKAKAASNHIDDFIKKHNIGTSAVHFLNNLDLSSEGKSITRLGIRKYLNSSNIKATAEDVAALHEQLKNMPSEQRESILSNDKAKGDTYSKPELVEYRNAVDNYKSIKNFVPKEDTLETRKTTKLLLIKAMNKITQARKKLEATGHSLNNEDRKAFEAITKQSNEAPSNPLDKKQKLSEPARKVLTEKIDSIELDLSPEEMKASSKDLAERLDKDLAEKRKKDNVSAAANDTKQLNQKESPSFEAEVIQFEKAKKHLATQVQRNKGESDKAYNKRIGDMAMKLVERIGHPEQTKKEAPKQAPAGSKFIGHGKGQVGEKRSTALESGSKVNAGQYNPNDKVTLAIDEKPSPYHFAETMKEAIKALRAGATIEFDSNDTVGSQKVEAALNKMGIVQDGNQWTAPVPTKQQMRQSQNELDSVSMKGLTEDEKKLIRWNNFIKGFNEEHNREVALATPENMDADDDITALNVEDGEGEDTGTAAGKTAHSNDKNQNLNAKIANMQSATPDITEGLDKLDDPSSPLVRNKKLKNVFKLLRNSILANQFNGKQETRTEEQHLNDILNIGVNYDGAKSNLDMLMADLRLLGEFYDVEQLADLVARSEGLVGRKELGSLRTMPDALEAIFVKINPERGDVSKVLDPETGRPVYTETDEYTVEEMIVDAKAMTPEEFGNIYSKRDIIRAAKSASINREQFKKLIHKMIGAYNETVAKNSDPEFDEMLQEHREAMNKEHDEKYSVEETVKEYIDRIDMQNDIDDMHIKSTAVYTKLDNIIGRLSMDIERMQKALALLKAGDNIVEEIGLEKKIKIYQQQIVEAGKLQDLMIAKSEEPAIAFTDKIQDVEKFESRALENKDGSKITNDQEKELTLEVVPAFDKAIMSLGPSFTLSVTPYSLRKITVELVKQIKGQSDFRNLSFESQKAITAKLLRSYNVIPDSKQDINYTLFDKDHPDRHNETLPPTPITEKESILRGSKSRLAKNRHLYQIHFINSKGNKSTFYADASQISHSGTEDNIMSDDIFAQEDIKYGTTTVFFGRNKDGVTQRFETQLPAGKAVLAAREELSGTLIVEYESRDGEIHREAVGQTKTKFEFKPDKPIHGMSTQDGFSIRYVGKNDAISGFAYKNDLYDVFSSGQSYGIISKTEFDSLTTRLNSKPSDTQLKALEREAGKIRTKILENRIRRENITGKQLQQITDAYSDSMLTLDDVTRIFHRNGDNINKTIMVLEDATARRYRDLLDGKIKEALDGKKPKDVDAVIEHLITTNIGSEAIEVYKQFKENDGVLGGIKTDKDGRIVGGLNIIENGESVTIIAKTPAQKRKARYLKSWLTAILEIENSLVNAVEAVPRILDEYGLETPESLASKPKPSKTVEEQKQAQVRSLRDKALEVIYKAIGKVFGAEVIFISDNHTPSHYVGKDSDGKSKIVLNRQDKNCLYKVLTHEVFHHVVNKSNPAQYKAVLKAAKEILDSKVDPVTGKTIWQGMVDKVRGDRRSNARYAEDLASVELLNENGKGPASDKFKADMQAIEDEEVLANLFSHLMNNSDFYKMLAKTFAGKRIASKLLLKAVDTLSKFNKLDHNNNPEIKRIMNAEGLSRLQDMLIDMVEQSVDSKTLQHEGKRYSTGQDEERGKRINKESDLDAAKKFVRKYKNKLKVQYASIFPKGTLGRKKFMDGIESILGSSVDFVKDTVLNKALGGRYVADFMADVKAKTLANKFVHGVNTRKTKIWHEKIKKPAAILEKLTEDQHVLLNNIMSRGVVRVNGEDVELGETVEERTKAAKKAGLSTESINAFLEFKDIADEVHAELKEHYPDMEYNEHHYGQAVKWYQDEELMEGELQDILSNVTGVSTRSGIINKSRNNESIETIEAKGVHYKSIDPVEVMMDYLDDAYTILGIKQLQNDSSRANYMMLADNIEDRKKALEKGFVYVDSPVFAPEGFYPDTTDELTSAPINPETGEVEEGFESTEIPIGFVLNVYADEDVDNVKPLTTRFFTNKTEADKVAASVEKKGGVHTTVAEKLSDKDKTLTAKMYWHPDLARMLKTVVGKDHIRSSKLGNQLMNAKNFTVAIEFAVSGFHMFTIAQEIMSSYSGAAMKNLKGTKKLSGFNIISNINNIRDLNALMEQIMSKPELAKDPRVIKKVKELTQTTFGDASKLVDLYLLNGGLYGGQDAELRSKAASFGKMKFEEGENSLEFTDDEVIVHKAKAGLGITSKAMYNSIVDAHKEYMKDNPNRKLTGAFKTAMFTATSALTSLLMEEIIPKTKAAIFYRELGKKLEKNKALPEDQQKTEMEIADDVMKFVNDRFGEVNWKTQWLDPTLKSTLQGTFRSYTWKAGTVVSLSKAGIDLAKKGWFTAKGEDYELTEKGYWGINAVINHMIAVQLVNAMYYVVMAASGDGEEPTDEDVSMLTKALYPRTDQYDSNSRIAIPSYVTELEKILHHLGILGSNPEPSKVWIGGLNSLILNAREVYAGKDFRGEEVRNSDDNLVSQAIDSTIHMMSIKPFVYSNVRKTIDKKGADFGAIMFSVMGFGMAPSHALHSDAVDYAYKLSRQKFSGGIKKGEQIEESTDLRRAAYQYGKGDRTAMQKLLSDGIITRTDKLKALKKIRFIDGKKNPTFVEPIVAALKTLNIIDAARVWDKMTVNEKNLTIATLRKKYRNILKRKTTSINERKEYRDAFKNSGMLNYTLHQ